MAHMQAGLEELKRMAAVKGHLIALPPGQDALVLAASAHWFASGQANILESIDKLGAETNQQKPLPPMFQAPKNREE